MKQKEFKVSFVGSLIVTGAENEDAASTAVLEGPLGHIPDGIVITKIERLTTDCKR